MIGKECMLKRTAECAEQCRDGGCIFAVHIDFHTNAVKNGDMAVVLMGKGHFTKGGHFIVLRGITAEGKILVADCNSRENTMTEWDFETIQSEAKWASDGGPFWIIRNPN